ncbi:meiotic nuclear division protein 1 homolog isoform X2 [Hydra vulgaris]|uniref:Meiotic nuclear division protein 1 homolog n=1 Tax=Hydra vulgaris TaxID=6087 RepID=A0ABM4CPT2_HYDVU
MSKKRGLSLEEKRTKMLEIFFEKKTFFQLKEIEKIAPKEKGITPMSVKEVLQSLVDDGLVDSERIGTSNYFWSYPSKGIQSRKRKVESLNQQIDELKTRKLSYGKSVEEAKEGKDMSDERVKVLEKLNKLEEENKKYKNELTKYSDCDPELLKQLEVDVSVATDAANRWTDNIFSLKSWCVKKFNMDSSVIDKQFGIPEDFDYIVG